MAVESDSIARGLSMESITPGDALSGYMLSAHLTFTLLRKGILTRSEAEEIVDKAIENLTDLERKAPIDQQNPYQDALHTLDELRRVISHG
jgi:hypothetical protein